MQCALENVTVGNPNPHRCKNYPCISCVIWYGKKEDMPDENESSEHDPKETVKEHTTDKFTEEKVEREYPDNREELERVEEDETHG